MEDYALMEDAAELHDVHDVHDFQGGSYANEDVFEMLLNDVGEATPTARRASTPHFTWTADEAHSPSNPNSNPNPYMHEMAGGPLKNEVLDDVMDMKGSNCHLIHPNLTWAGPLHQFSHGTEPSMEYEDDEMFTVPQPMEYTASPAAYDPLLPTVAPPIYHEDDPYELPIDPSAVEPAVNPNLTLTDPSSVKNELLKTQSQMKVKEKGLASNEAKAQKEKEKDKQKEKEKEKEKKPAGKRRGVRAHMTEEERREFLKRRNREAVRNCRKRKRELITRLTEREAVLRKENQRMRLQIRLGTESFKEEQSRAADELVKHMQEQLLSNPNPNAELKKLAIMYLALFCDVSGDPAYRLDRGEIPPKLVAEIYRYSYPTNYNKMYLWQNAQGDAYFKLEKKGLWEQLVKALGLKPKQMVMLKVSLELNGRREWSERFYLEYLCFAGK